MTRFTIGLLWLLLLAASGTPVRAGEERNRIPDLVARDLDGNKVNLKESLEGPAVVTFWATWCKPCRKELPELEKLVEKYGDRGFRVFGINGDGTVDRAKVRPYVKALGFDFTVIPDPDGEIRRRFQVEVFPTTFLVDGEGGVVHRQVGYRQGDEAILEKALLEILPSPETGTVPETDAP